MGVRLDDLTNSNAPVLATVPDKISAADAQNMGQSAVIQYTQPKPPPDLLQRGEEDIEKPFIQMTHTLGASMSWLGDNLKDETPFGELGTRMARAGIVMQERSMAELKDKFSNFTPNMLDDLIGTVPTIAGFMGLAAVSTQAIATGAVAASAGLGIGAEEFGKFKAMGKTTPQADALATAIGVPAGGVMALGFSRVSEMVEPWFTKMLGSTITKLVAAKAVGSAAAGAVGLGAQAAVTDTGEMATGIERPDAFKVLRDTVHNAIMGAVLGGGLGTTFALAQHAKFVDNLIKLGFSPKEANQSATAMMGQGAHVLMDKIDQHLDYTKDEQARIQAPAAKGEVAPNVLERSGIPQDLNFPPVDKEAMPDQDVVEMSKNFKYVKLRSLNIQAKVKPGATAEEIRKKYLGGRDVQRLENSYLHADLTKMIDQEQGILEPPVEQTKQYSSSEQWPLIEKMASDLIYHEYGHDPLSTMEDIKESKLFSGDQVRALWDVVKNFQTDRKAVADVFEDRAGGEPGARENEDEIRIAERQLAEHLMDSLEKLPQSEKIIVQSAKFRQLAGLTRSEISALKQRAMFRADRSREFMELALKDPDAAAEQLHQELMDLSGRTKDPDPEEVKETANQIESMRSVIEVILNPTPAMQKAMAEGKTYYDEQGAISKAMGTIDEIKENYHSSRLYKAAPLADFVKNLKSVNKKFSAHSLQRYYPDSWLAMADGKEFRTENFADALYDHAEEMTQVNYSRQMQNAMTEQKPVPLAAWVREGAMPPGWLQIGTSRKLIFRRDFQTGEVLMDENGNPQHHFVVFAAPKGLAEGLRPLTDPNYLKLIPGYQTLDKIQGFAKSGLLSASFFHHYTFACQTMASFDGYKTLAELPSALKNDIMSEPGFREMEKRFVKYGGTTQETHNIQDVWADINKGEDAFSKVLQKPVLKQITDVVDANTDLLFKGMQRYIKTTTFSRNMAKWEGEHPGASLEEIDAAAYGYAKSTNDAFGGQNWEMLGWNRTQVALARLFLLAPDWVVSNLSAAGRAFTKGGTMGSQARWTLASGIIGGLALNNILNYLRTGHSSFENKKGHEFEFEAEPDVYVNYIRGSPGELLKLASDIYESEGAPGLDRYAQGKLSPLASAYTRAASGVNFYGANIWKGHSALEKNINGFWNIAAPAIGIPIGMTGGVDYLQREQDKSLLGFSLVATGLGRFSKSGSSGRRRF